MEDMILAAKMKSLREFALETGKQINELEFYISNGILSESMKIGMENNIRERIKFTKEKIDEFADMDVDWL